MNRYESELIIGGVVVPLSANIDGWSQSYDPVDGGAALLRMADGSLHKQFRWAKTATTISAEGGTPPGLEGVDWNAPIVLACAMPRQMNSAGTGFTLPAARRADAGFTPRGFGSADGWFWQETAISLAGDIATLAPVAGATRYRVLWWPLMTVACRARPAESLDSNSGTYRWTWTAEET